jgi:hypothetical protein
MIQFSTIKSIHLLGSYVLRERLSWCADGLRNVSLSARHLRQSPAGDWTAAISPTKGLQRMGCAPDYAPRNQSEGRIAELDAQIQA